MTRTAHSFSFWNESPTNPFSGAYRPFLLFLEWISFSFSYKTIGTYRLPSLFDKKLLYDLLGTYRLFLLFWDENPSFPPINHKQKKVNIPPRAPKTIKGALISQIKDYGIQTQDLGTHSDSASHSHLALSSVLLQSLLLVTYKCSPLSHTTKKLQPSPHSASSTWVIFINPPLR